MIDQCSQDIEELRQAAIAARNRGDFRFASRAGRVIQHLEGTTVKLASLHQQLTFAVEANQNLCEQRDEARRELADRDEKLYALRRDGLIINWMKEGDKPERVMYHFKEGSPLDQMERGETELITERILKGIVEKQLADSQKRVAKLEEEADADGSAAKKRIGELEGEREQRQITQERFDCYKQGVQSRLAGDPLYKCPYEARTRKADAWENGWEQTNFSFPTPDDQSQRALAEREAGAGAMRKVLEQLPAWISVHTPPWLRKTAGACLDSSAGRDALERMQKLEAAVQQARDSLVMSADEYEQKYYPMAGPTCLIQILERVLPLPKQGEVKP